jgi:hypothetical protein
MKHHINPTAIKICTHPGAVADHSYPADIIDIKESIPIHIRNIQEIST